MDVGCNMDVEYMDSNVDFNLENYQYILDNIYSYGRYYGKYKDEQCDLIQWIYQQKELLMEKNIAYKYFRNAYILFENCSFKQKKQLVIPFYKYTIQCLKLYPLNVRNLYDRLCERIKNDIKSVPSLKEEFEKENIFHQLDLLDKIYSKY